MKMIVHRHLLCLNLSRFVKLVNLYVTNLLQSFSEKLKSLGGAICLCFETVPQN